MDCQNRKGIRTKRKARARMRKSHRRGTPGVVGDGEELIGGVAKEKRFYRRGRGEHRGRREEKEKSGGGILFGRAGIFDRPDKNHRASEGQPFAETRSWERSGVQVVEEEVDEDAGDGDVEPEREGPAGDATMKLELAAQGAADGEDHQGNDGHGKYGVTDEQGEVDGADISLPLEADRADLKMVNHIGDEEGGAADERGDHASAVDVDATAQDGKVAGEEKQGTRGVERGVEGGVREQGR